MPVVIIVYIGMNVSATLFWRPCWADHFFRVLDHFHNVGPWSTDGDGDVVDSG